MSYQEHTIRLDDEEQGAKDTLNMLISQLEGYRETTPKPEELEWEIRLYKYMLKDPVARMRKYYEERSKVGMGPGSKRQVAKNLGWEVE